MIKKAVFKNRNRIRRSNPTAVHNDNGHNGQGKNLEIINRIDKAIYYMQIK